MSSRGRRGRGRPPRTPLPARSVNFLRKPKAYQTAVSEGTDSRCSTPLSGVSSTGVENGIDGNDSDHRHNRRRNAASRGKDFISRVLQNNEGPEDSDAESSVRGDSDLEDPDFDDKPESDVSFEDDVSVVSENSCSTFGSRSKKYFMPRRPKTPEIPDANVPKLELPPSSTDIPIDNELVLKVVSVYEVLRHFQTILRLSPVRFEDFCAALLCDEQCCLLSEIHISLLRALQREEDGNNTTFGPSDIKDSINIGFYLLDGMTWPEIVRGYLDSDQSSEFQCALPALTETEYSNNTLKNRVTLLQCLTDLFLSSSVVREELMSEGTIKYNDHCRACHKYVYYKYLKHIN